MTEFIMKPKIDFAFKEIMENENARTGFLAAVLECVLKFIPAICTPHFAGNLSLIRDKSPANCDAQLTESNFKTHSRPTSGRYKNVSYNEFTSAENA